MTSTETTKHGAEPQKSSEPQGRGAWIVPAVVGLAIVVVLIAVL